MPPPFSCDYTISYIHSLTSPFLHYDSFIQQSLFTSYYTQAGFPHSSVGKDSACNAEDPGSIPGSGRSPGEGIGFPTPVFLGFPCGWAGKESTCSTEDLGSIPGLGRSPGE